MLGRMPVDIWSQDPSLSKRTLVCEQKDTRTHYEDSRSASYILKKKKKLERMKAVFLKEERLNYR